jgi:hypothetical protein
MSESDKELLVLAVKLVFRRIKEGKIEFAADAVPQTLKALEAVRFDDHGNPVFETITPPVRALANLVFALETKQIEEEAVEREINSPAHEFLVEPTEVTGELLRQCREKEDFTELAFKLYRETGCVLSVVAHAYIGQPGSKMALKLEQAICAGFVIRIVKFMISVVQLGEQADRGEVILALNRSIFESAVNLRVLVLKNSYDEFIKSGLSVERELYDLIASNIQARGGEVLPIESRMLESVQHTFDRSGCKLEDVNAKFKPWGGGMRNRLKDIGWAEAYVSMERIPSHAVHGTWVDLLFHHLKPADGRFAPDATWLSIDSRYLNPVCIVVLEAARDYLNTFLGDVPELKPLYVRLDDLTERILMVTRVYEEWLAAKYKNERDKES